MSNPTPHRKPTRYPVQCVTCGGWLWTSQARRGADSSEWEHRAANRCDGSNTAPPPPKTGSEWLHDLSTWGPFAEDELKVLEKQLAAVGLCGWCGDQLPAVRSEFQRHHGQCSRRVAASTLSEQLRRARQYSLVVRKAG